MFTEIRALNESAFKTHRPNIIVCPTTDETTEYKSYIGVVKPSLRNILATNVEIINHTDFNSLTLKERNKILSIKTLINRAWSRYENVLAEAWPSQDAISDVVGFLRNKNINFFPDDQTVEIPKITVRKLEEFFKYFLAKSHDETVIFSESHLTTTPLIRVLKEENPNAKIGMLVFDTHLDTDPGPGNDVPRKSNTLRLLTEDRKGENTHLVERISVIGVPDQINTDQKGSSWGIEKYSGRINPITEDELIGNDLSSMSISKKAFVEIIEKEMMLMKNLGITNLFISFDLDVLKDYVFGLTAIEYSIFHSLLYLSTLNLDKYRDSPQMLYDLLTNSGFAGEIDNSIIDYPITLGGRGLSVEFSQFSLYTIQNLCKKLGIEFGLKFGDTEVIGDIVELSGPDYYDNTKNTALQIAQSMASK